MAIPDTSSLAWIINARQDLVWFQGSVMAGLGLLMLFLSLPQPELTGLTIGHPILLAVFAWGCSSMAPMCGALTRAVIARVITTLVAVSHRRGGGRYWPSARWWLYSMRLNPVLYLVFSCWGFICGRIGIWFDSTTDF